MAKKPTSSQTASKKMPDKSIAQSAKVQPQALVAKPNKSADVPEYVLINFSAGGKKK